MNLWRAIEKRFKAPEWALFPEVGNATGINCRRHADAVAMNLWPSRGMEVVGIEMKASRSDWVRERDNPEKAEAVMGFCDRWYLAVENATIVRDGELPATWGLLVLNGDGLKMAKEAPKLVSKPLDRTFVAALLRRAAEHSPGSKLLEAERRAAHNEGHEQGKRYGEANAKRDTKALELIRENVAAFETASGIKINEYTDGADLGDLVRLVREITNGKGSRSCMNALRSNCRSIRENLESIEKAAGALDAALGHEVAP